MNKDFRIPRWEEIPDVDLHLDQIISLIDNSIGNYVSEDGQNALTKTMVNNYVKHKIIEAPDKKKYNKIAVASLFVITILKHDFSIKEIAELIKLAILANDVEISYNQFCEVLEDAVRTVFEGGELSARNELNEAQYILRNVCRTFACSLYVKETYFKKGEIDINTYTTL